MQAPINLTAIWWLLDPPILVGPATLLSEVCARPDQDSSKSMATNCGADVFTPTGGVVGKLQFYMGRDRHSKG
jgi:hypothetical protein